MKITFLGTGTSHGVPSIDCMIEGYARCKKNVCRESLTDPRHCRTRTSVLVEYNGKNVLIDVSSDFREQALREKIKRIDAVLMTHGHSDHFCGIPDIRSYTRLLEKPLDFFGSAETLDIIKKSFSYIFDPSTFVGGGIPAIELHPVNNGFDLFGEMIVPVPVTHGSLCGCYGYRIGPLAYIPDMKEISPSSTDLIRGVSCLILNCLRDERPHSTHLILEQSMALAREIRPVRCYFIHLCHDIHYVLDAGKLDPWMMFSYDGLKIEV
jgi:phosphoribosyl 1,2-cyclic phosphate phosphodiesterase